MNALQNVMLTAIAALLIVGISYMMKNAANDTTQKLNGVAGISAADVVPGSESMLGQ